MGTMPLKICAEPLGSNPANDTLLELAKVIDCVRSCAFFYLCEHNQSSAFRRRHAARPAAGGFRRATTRFGPHPISKRLLTKLLFSLLCLVAR